VEQRRGAGRARCRGARSGRRTARLGTPRRLDVLSRGAPAVVPHHAGHDGATHRHRSRHAARRIDAPGGVGRSRRGGVHRRAGRRGAHRGQSRVPRQDHPRQGDSPQAHRNVHHSDLGGLPGHLHGQRSSRPGRIAHLPDIAGPWRRGVQATRGSPASRRCCGPRWSG